MEQAAAVRLIPCAVRGSESLASQAIDHLNQIVAAAETPTYTRMAAICSLFGFKLSYNVCPYEINGEPSDEEEYRVFYDDSRQIADDPYTYSLQHLAERNLAVQQTVRRFIAEDAPPELAVAATRAILKSPRPEDHDVLHESIRLKTVDDLTKAEVLKELVKQPDLRTVEMLKAQASLTEAIAQTDYLNIYEDALVQLGVLTPRMVQKCQETIASGKDPHLISIAAQAAARVFAKSGDANAKQLLEAAVLDKTKPSGMRIGTIQQIASDRNMRGTAVVKLFQLSVAQETDGEVRMALQRAINGSSD